MTYTLTFQPVHQTTLKTALEIYLELLSGNWDILWRICIDKSTDVSQKDQFLDWIRTARSVVYPQPQQWWTAFPSTASEYKEIKELLALVSENTTITLTDRQSKLFRFVLERYSRVRMGQWQELLDICVNLSSPDYCRIRDELTPLLMHARHCVLPELSMDYGHSYGVGRFHDADVVWEVYEVLRNKIAWTERPEGGMTVDFDKPMSFSGEPLVVCKASA